MDSSETNVRNTTYIDPYDITQEEEKNEETDY